MSKKKEKKSTVTVGFETLKALNILKVQLEMKTLDEVIRHVLMESQVYKKYLLLKQEARI